jgi:hypothetical protein
VTREELVTALQANKGALFADKELVLLPTQRVTDALEAAAKIPVDVWCLNDDAGETLKAAMRAAFAKKLGGEG